MNRPSYKKLWNEEYGKRLLYQRFLLQTIKFIKDNNLVDKMLIEPDLYSFRYILKILYKNAFFYMYLDEDLDEELNCLLGDKNE